jgi:hypothetical protein
VTNFARSKFVRRRRGAFIALVVAVVIGAGVYVWVDARPASTDSLRGAVSAEVIGPIGQLRLVSMMEPSNLPGAPNIEPARDPASIPDTRIQVDVAVKLEETGLPVEPLDIEVDNRVVTLEGRVEDALLRDAIEVTVRSVQGVRQVDNRIEVVGE